MGRENRVGIWELLQSPKLEDLFKVALRALAVDLRTHTLCTVESYDPVRQRVDVTVDLRSRVNDPSKTDPNATFLEDPKPLKDIPVAWPRTSTGYLTFPLSKGDRGELHVQDRSIDGYLLAGLQAEPARRWTHDLADSVFHPCVFHNADPMPPTSLAGTVLEGTLVKLGREATEFAMKSSLWISYVNAVEAAFVIWTAAQPDPTSAANTVFIGSLAAANKALFLALSNPATSWVSTKVQVE